MGSAERDHGRRCIVLLLDGLGDRPVRTLGGRTPLEAARTPRLDRMVRRGRYGLVDPVGRGIVPNTHTGVGVMLGLRPEQMGLLHRGPVEAAGAGLRLEPGDVAFRANLATLERRDGRLYVVDRRAGRITRDSLEFASLLTDIELGDGVRANFQPTDQHRGVLVMSGPGLDAALEDTDPGDAGAPGYLRSGAARTADAAFTATKLDRFLAEAHRLMSEHPLNRERAERGRPPATGVITRGAGACFELDNALHANGLDATLVAGCNTVRGLARLFGIEAMHEDGFTADARTDIHGKLAAGVRALRETPLVLVHIKATDLFSHDFQPRGKMSFIERVDAALDTVAGCGAAFALTADHSTDSNSGAHTADPVPTLFHDPASPAGGRRVEFGEAACREGNKPRQTGHEFLMEIVCWLRGGAPEA